MPDGSNVTEEVINEIKGLVDTQRELAETNTAESKAALEKVEKELGEKFEIVDKANNDLRLAEKKIEETETRLKDLETEVSLANLSAKSGDDVVRTACDNAMASFMRKGVEAVGFDNTEDWIKKTAGEIVAFSSKGLDEHMTDLLTKEMVYGIDPNGGYLIPPAPSQMIQTKVFETSPVRALANVVSTGTGEYEFILDDDQAASGWVGEIDARPDTDTPTVGMIKIPVHELYAKPRTSQKMLDNAGFDIENWLINKVSRKFGRDEATAFVAGNGALKPKGFLSYTASSDADVYQRDTVGQLETAGSGVIAGDDIKGLLGLVKQEYQNGSVFGMKRSTWTTVTKLKDSQNRYLFDMISNLRDGDILKLLGQSVVLMNDMPAITASALSVVYGNFREFYTVVDGIGIRVLRDPYSSKPYIEFYSTTNVGGAVTNFEAAKLLKIKA